METKQASVVVHTSNTLKEIKLAIIDGSEEKSGICVMFLDITYKCLADELARCGVSWTTWPKYSGDIEYPVPHPELLPKIAYYKTRGEHMWDDEYGANRMELLDWLIEQLDKKLCA